MRAAILEKLGGPLVVRDLARPRPGQRDVLVEVRACGVLLTLVWSRDRKRHDHLPRILGHEISGVVAEVGADVDGIRPGERVAVYYYLTCGSCPWCLRGRENLCEDMRGHVGREIDGGLAEYVVVPAANVCRVPEQVGFVDAAVAADAIGTALHVLTNRARLEPGETVLVVGGAGGVGVHVVQIARLLGARVIAVDISAEKLACAVDAGADDVIDASACAFDDEARRLTRGRGVDVVVEMVGTDETLVRSAASVGRGARLVLVGSYDRDATLPLRHDTLRGEGSVLGSQYCTRFDVERALGLVAAGRVRPIVPHLCDLDDVDETLRRIEQMELAGRACVVLGDGPLAASG